MASTEHIRKTFERNRKALQLKPSLGQNTGYTKICVRDGTTCEIENGEWKFTVDLGETDGGNNKGPGPGVLERAALGSCLAIGYSKWAAYMEVPIDSIEVEVESDIDARASFGLGQEKPGYSEIRYNVHVSSEAPEEEVRKVLDEADRHSPVLDDFTRGIPVKRNEIIKQVTV